MDEIAESELKRRRVEGCENDDGDETALERKDDADEEIHDDDDGDYDDVDEDEDEDEEDEEEEYEDEEDEEDGDVDKGDEDDGENDDLKADGGAHRKGIADGIYQNGDDDDEDEDDDDFHVDGSSSDDDSGFGDGGQKLKMVSVIREWVATQKEAGVKPQELLVRFGFSGAASFEDEDEGLLWSLVQEFVLNNSRMVSQGREKLHTVNSMEDALELMEKAQNIMVLTGAGVSVSCGIPDFRSSKGLYAQLREKFPELSDPQMLFDIEYFRYEPQAFYSFAKDLYPGSYKPSPCHRFIKLLEEKGKLLRCYTQNIDTLEQVAGIDKVVFCHGSFATASCIACKQRIPGDAIREEVMNQTVPYCKECQLDDNIIKPDIVFFGENLGDEFRNNLSEDKKVVDLLIVIGSSLKVHPVASVVGIIPSDVPQILINREVVGQPNRFDIELLGDCDGIVGHLCKRLGWSLDAPEVPEPEQAASNRFLFPGAVVDASDSDSDDNFSEDDEGDEGDEGDGDEGDEGDEGKEGKEGEEGDEGEEGEEGDEGDEGEMVQGNDES